MLNHIHYSSEIKKKLAEEGINVSQYKIRKILNSFLTLTIKGLISHKIIDWLYFQFQYNIPRLRRDADKYPMEYKTKYFEDLKFKKKDPL